ncbi:MAG TPA: hypothetical protein VH502_09830 [Actinoplanes sp.]|jgi:hypothetical protein
MTRFRGLWTTAAVTLFVITACARPDGTGSGPAGTAPSGAPSSAAAGADTLVVRIERVGGLMAPEQMPGKLPLISVYADGRLITPGPQIAIYPPPALPSVQVQQLERATVDSLLAKADAAGIRSSLDLGHPMVADAPTTRITVATGEGARTLEVVGLTEASADDPRLTPAQRDARAKVAQFVQDVTEVSAAKGMPQGQPYRAASLAALASPYVAPSDGLPKKPRPIDWPGPTLPGAPLGAVSCVTVSGAEAAAVLQAAADATAITPWRSGGKVWNVRFRPLLPDETGCADLATTK